MGPPQRGDTPVQIVRHCQFFTGRLGVKVNQCDRRFPVGEKLIRHGKRVRRFPVQQTAPYQIDHADTDSGVIKIFTAVSGGQRAEIRGA